MPILLGGLFIIHHECWLPDCSLGDCSWLLDCNKFLNTVWNCGSLLRFRYLFSAVTRRDVQLSHMTAPNPPALTPVAKENRIVHCATIRFRAVWELCAVGGAVGVCQECGIALSAVRLKSVVGVMRVFKRLNVVGVDLTTHYGVIYALYVCVQNSRQRRCSGVAVAVGVAGAVAVAGAVGVAVAVGAVE
eukprot:gene1896-4990_t